MKATLWTLTLLFAGVFAQAGTEIAPSTSLAPELNAPALTLAGGWGAVSEPIDPQSSGDEPDTRVGIRDCIAYGSNAAGYDSWAG